MGCPARVGLQVDTAAHSSDCYATDISITGARYFVIREMATDSISVSF